MMLEKSSEEAIIIKASNTLKLKAGSGGFDPRNIQVAERRLDTASHIFPEAASLDIEIITQELKTLAAENDFGKSMPVILASCVELKSHSIMFQFPLVTEVIQRLLHFCDSLEAMSPLARQVITLHLKVLKIAIDQGPRAITSHDRIALLEGLEKASEKALAPEKYV